jgi:hypothetical protein
MVVAATPKCVVSIHGIIALENQQKSCSYYWACFDTSKQPQAFDSMSDLDPNKKGMLTKLRCVSLSLGLAPSVARITIGNFHDKRSFPNTDS